MATADINFAEWYESWAELHRAIIEVEIQNFANIPLTGGALLANKGITRTSFIELIEAGSREAFAWRQNKPEAIESGVELCARYNIVIKAVDFYVVVCAKAYQQTLWREPNELSVCIIEKSKVVDPDCYDDWVNGGCALSMKIQNIGKTMQCCKGDFCVQGMMDTNHQPKVTVRFWPKKIDQLEYRGDTVDQSGLTAILDHDDTCHSDNVGDGAGEAYMGGKPNTSTSLEINTTLILLFLALVKTF